jgi:hypothetical protein
MVVMSAARVDALLKERYRKGVPNLYEGAKTFCARLKKREDVELVGRRTIRAAKKTAPGGQFRTFNPDGGDLGRGSGASYEVTTMTTLPLLLALEKTKSAMWETEQSDLSIKNAVQEQLTDGVSEFATHCDRHLMGAGNGVLATTLSGAGTATVVMTTPIRSRWVRENNKYTVYDTALTTNKGMVEIAIGGNDKTTGTVTFINSPVNPTIAAMVNGDVLMVDNITGATPSWIFGLRYHHSSAATGFWMGLNRANFSELRTVQVPAGGPLMPTHFRQLKNRMALLRDDCFKTGSWSWVLSPAQQQAYEELSLQITTRQREGTNRQGPELLDNVDEMKIDGMEVLVSSNCDPSVIDLVRWDNWWRGETVQFGLYTIDEIDTFPIYGASGGVAAADIMYFCQLAQWGVDDPRMGGYISGLSVPTGY